MTTDTFSMQAARPIDPLTPLYAALGIAIAFLLPSVIAGAIDPRTLDGVSVWSKPLKFEISLSLHMATLIALAALIDPGARQTRLFRWTMSAASFAVAGELTYMLLQAARGRASHFNQSTPIEGAMYAIMGLMSLLLVVAPFVAGILVLRRPSGAGGAGLRFGAGLGLLLGAVLTLVLGGYMGNNLSHAVGASPTDSLVLPVFGWSLQHGDLRVPHFFGTHLMQALPILGLLADRWLPANARTIVAAGALAGLAVALATFVQALYGLPFIRL